MSILTLGRKQKKKENSQSKIGRKQKKAKQKEKIPRSKIERKQKRQKIPDQTSEENKRNMQKGLWTRQYLNNTKLSPSKQEKRNETMT